MAPRNTVVSRETFTPSEQAHLDSRGETPLEVTEETASPEPDPEPIPEPEEIPADEAPLAAEVDPKTKMVPHGALHEEREARKREADRAKRAEAALEASNQRQLLLEQRTNMLLQGLQQPQEQATEIPSIEKDPAGHIIGLLQQQQRTIDQLTQANQMRSQYDQQTLQQREQMDNLNKIANRSITMESEFRKAQPDYDDATTHVMTMRDAQLVAAGYTDPGERRAILQQEAQQIGIRAAALDQNPAEMIYNIAKSLGYQPKKAEAQQTQTDQASNVTRIETAQRGREQSTSLSQVRGNGTAPMTTDTLLRMNDKEFAKFSAENAAAFRRMMGE